MKIKNYTVSIFVFSMVLLNHNSYSQNGCQTPEVSLNPEGERAFNEYVNKFKAEGKHLNTDLKIIPIVIHVIYRNKADKKQISWARIRGQIDASNKQLRRLNANAKDTRPIFVPVAADCNIQVALATRKPDRSKFKGVIYHKYPDFHINNFSAIRSATILDPGKYLNVWVLPGLSNGLAILPWIRTATIDGFYIGAAIFGTKGSNLEPLQNGGATFTHELGHCLGLWHTTEGSSGYPGRCDLAHDGSMFDFCSDTPLDWTHPFGIPDECDDGVRTPCETSPDGLIAQTENYMYYNPDRCLNMFSKDQRARMRACLHGIRSELVSFSNLLFTGVKKRDHKEKAAHHNDVTTDKPALEKSITIFPNPANDIVHITYNDLAVKKDMKIVVYNQVGQKLKEIHSRTAISELSLGSLSEGVYYITVTIDNVSATKYIIKTGSKGFFFAK
ncbi:MAG: M43 family zinc metalloprotease [Ginsengibacter sp.]